MMKKAFILFLSAFLSLAVCADTEDFDLTESSALSRVTSTAYVNRLAEKYPNIHLHTERVEKDRIDIYLGFNEGTHTTRHSSLMVDKYGKVYRNTDETLATEKWEEIK